MTATPVSNPERPSASFGNSSSATSAIIDRAAVLPTRAVAPASRTAPGCSPDDAELVSRSTTTFSDEVDRDDRHREPDRLAEAFEEDRAERREQHAA